MSVKHLPARQTQRVKYSDNVVGKEGLISGQSLETAATDIATLKEDVATMKAGTFSSGLSVTGNVEATGSIKAGADLEVTGDTTVGGDIEATGSIKAGADLEVTGDATVGGDIEATGHLKSAYSVITPKLTTTGASISAEKPVVEVMTGYSFASNNTRISMIYAGACKNGNKLTFSVFGTYTSDGAVHDESIGTFTIPADIGNQLLPYELGGLSVLSNSKIYAATSIDSSITLNAYVSKYQPTVIAFRFKSSSSMTSGTSYLFRYEVTFLLSDNMIPSNP